MKNGTTNMMKSVCVEPLKKPRPGMNEPAASQCENPASNPAIKDQATVPMCYMHSKNYVPARFECVDYSPDCKYDEGETFIATICRDDNCLDWVCLSCGGDVMEVRSW